MIHVIHLHYLKPFSEIEPHIAAHRKFLDQGYESGLFLMSGPLNTKSGGMIIATGDLSVIKTLLEKDPYNINDIAEYEYFTFDPLKHQSALSALIK